MTDAGLRVMTDVDPAEMTGAALPPRVPTDLPTDAGRTARTTDAGLLVMMTDADLRAMTDADLRVTTDVDLRAMTDADPVEMTGAARKEVERRAARAGPTSSVTAAGGTNGHHVPQIVVFRSPSRCNVVTSRPVSAVPGWVDPTPSN